MLKISIVDTPTQRKLVLEGKLIEPWLAELLQTWSEATQNLGGRKLVVDLRNVILISPEGENALLALMTEGATFVCHEILTRHVLQQLKRRCRCKLQAMFAPVEPKLEETQHEGIDDASDQAQHR